MKSLVDGVVVTCDGIANDEIDHWHIPVVPLAIMCSLLLVVIVVEYMMECRLTILCLFSCQYRDE